MGFGAEGLGFGFGAEGFGLLLVVMGVLQMRDRKHTKNMSTVPKTDIDKYRYSYKQTYRYTYTYSYKCRT